MPTLLCDGDPMVVFVAGRWCCLLCRRQCKTMEELQAHLQDSSHVAKEAAGRKNGRIVEKPSAMSVARERVSAALRFGSQVRLKLFTRQDWLHVHKLLGVSCALNFGKKSVSLLRTTEVRPCDVALVMHVALAFSSFVFRLPKSTVALTHGYLSQETRLHTVCFSARALTLIVVDEMRAWAEAPLLSARGAGLWCLPFHLAIDAVTRALGTPGITSIRGSHDPGEKCRYHEWWARFTGGASARDAVRPLLSGAQFVNNHALLFGAQRRQGIAFAWLAWSQLNAFLMTLRRKQLISEEGLAASYTLLTTCVTAACLAQAASPLASLSLGALMMALRARGCNKYALWLGLLAVSPAG